MQNALFLFFLGAENLVFLSFVYLLSLLAFFFCKEKELRHAAQSGLRCRFVFFTSESHYCVRFFIASVWSLRVTKQSPSLIKLPINLVKVIFTLYINLDKVRSSKKWLKPISFFSIKNGPKSVPIEIYFNQT